MIKLVDIIKEILADEEEYYSKSDEYGRGISYNFAKIVSQSNKNLIKFNTSLYELLLDNLDTLPSLKKSLIDSKTNINIDGNNPYTYHNGRPLKPSSVSGDIYDFGGFEAFDESDYFPEGIRNRVYIIDDYDDVEESVEDEGYKGYIQADLSKTINLPPLNGINITNVMSHIDKGENIQTVSNNINNCLNPGGIVNILDTAEHINTFLSLFPSYKILYISFPSQYDFADVNVVLKK